MYSGGGSDNASLDPQDAPSDSPDASSLSTGLGRDGRLELGLLRFRDRQGECFGLRVSCSGGRDGGGFRVIFILRRGSSDAFGFGLGFSRDHSGGFRIVTVSIGIAIEPGREVRSFFDRLDQLRVFGGGKFFYFFDVFGSAPPMVRSPATGTRPVSHGSRVASSAMTGAAGVSSTGSEDVSSDSNSSCDCGRNS